MSGTSGTYWQTSVKELKTTTFWRDVFSEFLGTFFLVATQCSLLVNWHERSQGGAIINGLGMGFVVTILASVMGDFSGGHLNPAVTTTMMVLKKTLVFRGFIYIVAQLAGGILSAGFIYLMTPTSLRVGLGVTMPGNGVEFWQTLLIETWITCTLVIAVLSSTNARRKVPTFTASVPIGFAVGLGLFVGYGYSGGSMNPARSFGPAVINNVWTHHWVYWVGPIAGGLLAVLMYSVMLDRVDSRPHEDKTLDVSAVCPQCLQAQNGGVKLQYVSNHSHSQ